MKSYLLYILTLCILGIPSLWAVTPGKDNAYTEHIHMHVGSKQLIAGERLPYKASCFSSLENRNEFVSTVLYVELTNSKHTPITQQVLKITDNQAAGVIHLPDTLKSGTYLLKAYTNWMKNFGMESFSVTPLYVFNQYDKQHSSASIQYPCIPELYIQGGSLLAKVPVRMYAKIPLLYEEQLQGTILDEEGRRQCTFTTNIFGEAYLEFTPQAGKKYRLQYTDSLQIVYSYPLPQVQASGYRIGLLGKTEEGYGFSIYSPNVTHELVKFQLLHGSHTQAETTFRITAGIDTVFLNAVLPEGVEIRAQLVDEQQDILHIQSYFAESTIGLHCKVPPKAGVNSHLEIQISADAQMKISHTGASAQVVKLPSHFPKSKIIQPATYGHIALHRQGLALPEVFPRYTLPAEHPVGYPAEDLGILLHGSVQVNNGVRLNQLDVLLAVEDTLGSVSLAPCNKQGGFTFLYNEWGNKNVQFYLSSNGVPLQLSHQMVLEDKFHSPTSQNAGNVVTQQKKNNYTQYLTDESCRVLIQRAYQNTNTISEASVPPKTHPFYGVPTYTVYPGEYVEMDNFEQLVREIVPSVRYKYSKGNAHLSVFDIETSLRSDYPVVLLDGTFVQDVAPLYPLSSKDIHRIEVQSGNSGAGNLFYQGLVAVYTSPEYRNKQKKQEPKGYLIPGYQNHNAVWQVPDSVKNTPNFENLLYWNPYLLLDSEQTGKFNFTSTDEEGRYLVSIQAFTPEGFPVFIQKIIQISDAK